VNGHAGAWPAANRLWFDAQIDKEKKPMCCLFTILLFLGPRAAIVVWWLVQPLRWQMAFGGFIWGLLGFLFMPWTTLMYAGIGLNGLVGLDWLWIGLAVLADLGMYAGGGYGNRDRIAAR
jgi:hypothetical protein